MKIVKYTLLGLAVLLVGVQAIRPARTNPPAMNPLPIEDTQVESILKRSCFDCHSNETRWPWYSEVAPVSWQIVNHVNDGRKHVNFSDWNEEKAAKRFDEMCEEVREGNMPITGYTLLHRNAKLSSADVNALCNWSQARLAASGQPPAKAEEEHDEH